MSGRKKSSKQGMTLFILLVFLVFLLAGYLLITNYHKKQEEKEAAEQEAKENEKKSTFMINEEEASNYQSLSVHSDNTTLVMNREENGWTLDGEEEFPIDSQKVDSMAEMIAQLSASKKVDDASENLSDYGLSEPEIIIQAKRNDGSTFDLNIGDQLLVDTNYYGSTNDSDYIYVLPLDVYETFDIQKTDLIYRPDLPYQADQIQEIELSTIVGGNFHIIREENNPYDYSGMNMYNWHTIDQEFYPENIDSTTANTLLGEYTSFPIKEGIDYGEEAMETYGLLNPAGDIRICYTDDSNVNKEFTLHVGRQNSDGDYYVSMNEDQIVYLMTGDDLTQKVMYEPSDIVTKLSHLVNISDVTEMGIKTSELQDTYTYTTESVADGEENTTTIFMKNGVVGDETELRTLFRTVVGLTHNGCLPYNTTVTGEPVLSIRFTLTNGKEINVGYYEYDTDNYAVVLNGLAQYTADKSQIDSVLQTLQ